jgi:ubiquinone/menaquinone biosynthesis C-methylase UbiE
MKLSTKEFDAMQMGWRKWYIEKIELKTFEKFGLDLRGADVLEVGCGNGYAATLITKRGVNSYTGLDIMPEQLAIGRKRNLPNATFVQGSADDLSRFADRSFDAILDFCILHHVEGWRTFFNESRRVLKDGGSIYVAELSKRCIHIVDTLLHWDHAEEALFTLKEFEEEANKRGFETVNRANDLGLEGYFRFRKKEN